MLVLKMNISENNLKEKFLLIIFLNTTFMYIAFINILKFLTITGLNLILIITMYFILIKISVFFQF